MKNIIKHLWLAISLIVATSFILLMSDREQRAGYVEENKSVYPSIAIMQIASTGVLDSHVAGIVDRLEEEGFRAPDGKNIRIYNPQGDYATANAMARDIANSPYDMVITSSTVALQTFAKANKATKKTHVFGAVTDPFGTGVGITGPEPHQHPSYIAGVGTFQPVEQSIRIAYEMNPDLKRLGVVWNPGEQCSEACLDIARATCQTLGVELVEANAANTSEVSEAARSLFARNVDAVWIGGDSVAIASAGLIVSLAKQAGIPVFTNSPSDAEKGALFGLGADYYTVGQYTADIAVAIFEGKKPSAFRIENKIPEQLGFNHDVLATLTGAWTMRPSVKELLARQEKQAAEKQMATDSEPGKTGRQNFGFSMAPGARSRPFKLAMALYSETEFAEQCRDGLLESIHQAGYLEGRDYNITIYNAQGDMSTLSSIMSTVKADHVDLLMVISTPTLQAALRQAGEETKIVFTGVADGVRAGAGKSETDHLPNVTGISTRSPFAGMARIIRQTLPNARRVGTLFTPAEINSVLYRDWFQAALKKEGLALISIPVTSSTDVAQSAIELCKADIQVVAQVVDNLTRPGFALIARKASENDLPVYVFDSDQMKYGGVVCLARDYFDAGREAGEKVVRILRGEHPKDIPFNNTRSEKFILNPELARKYKLRVPEAMREQAELYVSEK